MLTCSACSQENPPEARFCLACGAALAAGQKAPHDERRVVSVIFVDLVGFTARAERLDPEEVQALLAPYHDRVRREIESFGGVVEKFIGDAIMGVFGAPLAHGDDPDRAVRAALVIRDAAGELAEGGLQIRIAVNTGEAVVSLGARPAFGESMIAGDVVNTAARLQTAAPVNGVVVGVETYLATRGLIEYEVAAPVVAKGKEHPVAAWIAIRPLTAAGLRAQSGHELIGRTSEIAILAALWRRAADEQLPHLVSVFGPAGVGKSTLSEAFALSIAGADARILRGRSLPYRESGTYGALASQIMQLCGVFESDAADVVVEKLRTYVASIVSPDSVAASVVGHLGVIVGVDAGAEAADRDVLFASVRRFLESAAEEQPTLLVFEDIHWADANLLDLVHTLAVQMRDLPIMFVALSRPDLLDRRDDWGAALAGYTSLTIGPLGDQQARELATRRLGDDDRADEVIRLAEGNPLFIEQLAASIGEMAPGELPTSIRGIVAARLDALPAAERALLLNAAVVGKVFWFDALTSLGADAATLPQLLEALERRDLIRGQPISIIEGQRQFAFTHVLIRDVAYDLLPRADRARLHAQVAEFFGSATGDSGEAIGAMARHWRAAGEHERAVEQLVRAAERAERGWAKDHAALLYREALLLVPESDGERRADLRRRLALASTASFHLLDVKRGESPPA